MGWEAQPAVDTTQVTLHCDAMAQPGEVQPTTRVPFHQSVEMTAPPAVTSILTQAKTCLVEVARPRPHVDKSMLTRKARTHSLDNFHLQSSLPFRVLGREGTRDLERHTETLTKHVRGQDCPFLSHSPSDLSGPSTTPAKGQLISIGTRSLRAHCRKFPGPTSDSS